MRSYKYFQDNEWKDSSSGSEIDIFSPFDNSVVGKVQSVTMEEVDSIVESAHKAFRTWKNVPLFERGKLLNKVADIIELKSEDLAKQLEKEIAKPYDASLSEIHRSVEYIRFTVDAARNMTDEIFHGDAFEGYTKGQKTGLSLRVPLGTVLAISPYNYPINLSLTKIAPALVSGNTVVFKPATQGSITALQMVMCFEEAGFPAGVISAFTGKSSEIGDFMVQHKKIALIAFTGSSKTGLHIAEATKGRVPLLMEMGGKDSTIVLKDADLDLAASEIVKGGLSFCGQRCTAVKRVFAESEIIDELTQKIAKLASEVKLGPLVSQEQKEFVSALIEDAKQKGAISILEGQVEGNSIQPTVLTNVTDKARIFHEEQFGPVIPLTTMESIEKSVDWINTSPYALQSSIYTKDIDKAFMIAEMLDTGSVQINGKSDRGPDNFPFIGVRESGIGPAQGTKETIRAMTREKIVVINRK